MEAEPETAEDDGPAEINNSVYNARNTTEDIMTVRGMGLDVDNDNDPAPQNVPTPGEDTSNGLNEDQSWGRQAFASERDKTLPRLHLKSMV